jgi:biotin synthase-like enzyme
MVGGDESYEEAIAELRKLLRLSNHHIHINFSLSPTPLHNKKPPSHFTHLKLLNYKNITLLSFSVSPSFFITTTPFF